MPNLLKFLFLITLTIITNADENPQTIISSTKTIQIDNQPIELKISIDISTDETLRPLAADLSKRYFQEWPKLVKLLNAPSNKIPHHLHISFRQLMGHPAHVSGTNMVIEIQHIRRDPADLPGVFTHELTHFVQNYPPGTPTWLSEGIADYTRYKIHPNSKWTKINQQHTNKLKPKAAYWQTTAFLLWVEKTYRKPLVKTLSKAAKDGKYKENLWKTITGKTLQELTELYAQS